MRISNTSLGVALALFAAAASAGAPKKAPERPLPCDENPPQLNGFEFESILLVVKKSAPAYRLTVLDRNAHNVRMTSAQAGELLSAFSGPDRFKLLQWVRPRLTDKDKALTLSEHFNPDEQRRARAILLAQTESAGPKS